MGISWDLDCWWIKVTRDDEWDGTINERELDIVL